MISLRFFEDRMAKAVTHSDWFPNGGYILAAIDSFDHAPEIRPLREGDRRYQELPIYVRRAGLALTGVTGCVFLISLEPENQPGPCFNWLPIKWPESEDEWSTYYDLVGWLLECEDLDAETTWFALHFTAKVTEKVAAAYNSWIGQAFENGAIRA